MSGWIVQLQGCRRVTTVRLDLDDGQAAFLEWLGGLTVAASTIGCEPRLTIRPEEDER